MSDQPPTHRPFDATEWEEERHIDDNAATDRTNRELSELIESTKAIADNASAVEKLTKESIVADNVKFRRRNALLVGLVCVLIVGLGYLIYRDIWVNSPERARIVEQTDDLKNANEKLDDINEFIERVEADNDGGASREELQIVFDAVFDTKAMVECVITAPDEASVRNCVIE